MIAAHDLLVMIPKIGFVTKGNFALLQSKNIKNGKNGKKSKKIINENNKK